MTLAASKAPRKGAGRVAFLARLDSFASLMNAGHPQRSIYDDHAASLGISYSQFNRYVGKYILGKISGRQSPSGQTPKRDEDSVNAAGHGNNPPSTSTSHSEQENNDGPKAPPRPRGFVRLDGLPDDNKDKLI